MRSMILCTLFVMLTACASHKKDSGRVVYRGKVQDFNQLTKIIAGLKHPSKTLLVMDDDDTLTMIGGLAADKKQYLGGPAWFSWQQSLLKTKSTYRVAKSFPELLNISKLLLAVNHMNYSSSQVPGTLAFLTDSGVHLLVETARAPVNSSATVSQFSNLAVKGNNSKNLLSLVSNNALVGKHSKMPSLPGPYKVKDQTKTVIYQQGVLYCTGQNKGILLKNLLEATESSDIENIVFIDDTLVNVQNVYKEFKKSSYSITALHYTALSAHKQALTIGPKAQHYQRKSRDSWNALKRVLEKKMVNPALSMKTVQQNHLEKTEQF
ncbi:MAG: DUF2608 domain-containing protein [Lentisphaeraceae bacterium]|nr:DUF2608 domain-containing protein [Lentisphaeraceae bacterium]